MDEEKFIEEAKALLEMARELSMKSGIRMNISIFPEGQGWVTSIKDDNFLEDINIGYKNL